MSEFYHAFECGECESRMLVEANNIHDLPGEEWWPKFCCACGKTGTMFLDWKKEFKLIQSIDVAIRGGEYEDIETHTWLDSTRVTTPLGMLSATELNDPYPGIVIKLEDRQIALIEYYKESCRVIVWADCSQEYYTHDITIQKE